MDLHQIGSRLRRDRSFRDDFKTDPRPHLQRAGVEVADEHDVVVIEMDPAKHYVLIPPEDEELSDDQLDQLEGAGGGLAQLVAYGAQDVYLTGNPQITFFK